MARCISYFYRFCGISRWNCRFRFPVRFKRVIEKNKRWLHANSTAVPERKTGKTRSCRLYLLALKSLLQLATYNFFDCFCNQCPWWCFVQIARELPKENWQVVRSDALPINSRCSKRPPTGGGGKEVFQGVHVKDVTVIAFTFPRSTLWMWFRSSFTLLCETSSLRNADAGRARGWNKYNDYDMCSVK